MRKSSKNWQIFLNVLMYFGKTLKRKDLREVRRFKRNIFLLACILKWAYSPPEKPFLCSAFMWHFFFLHPTKKCYLCSPSHHLSFALNNISKISKCISFLLNFSVCAAQHASLCSAREKSVKASGVSVTGYFRLPRIR